MIRQTMRRPSAAEAPSITNEITLTVDAFAPNLFRRTSPNGTPYSWHSINVTVTPDPETPFPPPFDRDTLSFSLDFYEQFPEPLDPEERLFHLFLPITEFPAYLQTLQGWPCYLFLSINLQHAQIIEANLQPRPPQEK